MAILKRGSMALGSAGLGLLLVILACTKANPDYDPEAYCEPGARRCADGETVLVCRQDESWPDPDAGEPWVYGCWAGTKCAEGRCLAEESTPTCTLQADCGGSLVCTFALGPDGQVGTFCLPPPNPSGAGPGQACNVASDCLSGRCTRHVCFEPCETAADCTNPGQECDSLDVTVDGLKFRDAVLGCVPPQ